jgi:hypothetical protein
MNRELDRLRGQALSFLLTHLRTSLTALALSILVIPTAMAGMLEPMGYLKASNTNAGDRFGVVALSTDGNTLAVGAINEASAATGINGNQADNSAAGAGAVYIYTRSGTTWSQQAYIKASNTGTSDQFGGALALSSDGNTLAVGAVGEASAATGINGNQADNSALALSTSSPARAQPGPSRPTSRPRTRKSVTNSAPPLP